MVSLCKLGAEHWGHGWRDGGALAAGQRDRDRGEGEIEMGEGGETWVGGERERDIPLGRDCGCLMKTLELTKPKHSELFKAVFSEAAP